MTQFSQLNDQLIQKKLKKTIIFTFNNKLLKIIHFSFTDNQLLKKYFKNNLKIFTTMYCMVFIFLHIFA